VLTDAEKDAALLRMFGTQYAPRDSVSCKRRRTGNITSWEQHGEGIVTLPGDYFAIRGREVTVKAFGNDAAEVYESFQDNHASPGREEQLHR
jgi:hypothetical protein